MKIIKDDTGAVVGFIGESVMSEHSVNMLEEALKKPTIYMLATNKLIKIS